MIFEGDVVIIGAGPAGCASAIWCASRGLRTAIVEALPFPRHRPGESLHPGIEPLLEQLGAAESFLAANFPRFDGNLVSWSSAPIFQPFGEDAKGPWRGFHAWRADLDQILLLRAVNAGAILFQPCRATGVLGDAGRIRGIRCGASELHARFVIDASGRAHFLQRRLRLAASHRSEPLLASYGYCSGRCDAASASITGGPDGWTWIAEVKPELWAWVRLCFGSLSLAPPEPLCDLQIYLRPRGADVTWRIVNDCAGPSYFIAGDAANVVDPLSSQGVLKAIMSGIMAADLIVRSPQFAIETYRAWMHQRFELEIGRLRAQYAVIRPSFNSSPIA